MRITELFTAQSIALDEALQTQEQILSRLVELQATHGNITDKEAYKKALYAREAEGSTYVDNGITVPHAKTNVVTRPSLAALRLSTPVQYNAEDDGTTDLLFAIAAPENGSLHVDMLARMMQMLMNEDFVEKLKAAKTPKEFLECIDAQEEAQFGAESFTQQAIPQDGYRILAVTACVNGIAHTYMAAEALTKAGDKLGLPTKVETNGSDGAKNILTRAEIAACDGIIVAAEKKVDTARFDGKPVLFTRVDDGIHKPEELIKKIAHGEVPVFHAEGGAADEDDTAGKDSFGRSLYKNLMNGVSHMLPFVVGGGIMIALAFLLDDYSINPANFGMNTPVAAFFKTVGGAAFGYMLPILAGFIAMSIADRPGLAVGFAGGVLAMNGTNFAGIANGETTGISGGFLAALLAGFAAGALWALLPTLFAGRNLTSLSVATIMMNSIAALLTEYIVKSYFQRPGASNTETVVVNEGSILPRFLRSTQFNYGIFVALFCVAAVTWMLYKTPFGFSLRAMGQNPRAMQQAGLPIYRRTLAAMCISGGLFALGGAIQCLAVYKRFVMGFSPGYGWDGITVATLAMNSPVGVLLSAFLFGMLRSASISMSLTSQVTTEMISELQPFIDMLVDSPDVWNVLGHLWQRLKSCVGRGRKQEGAAE